LSDKRTAALDAFLALVGEKGFAAVTLRDVAQPAGLSFAELYALFPNKASLVAAFLARIDDTVLAGTPTAVDPEETARDRLFDVMMRRYDALGPNRAFLRALRRAMSTDPLFALSIAPALRRSMAAMLEAAAIPADGLPGAARQSGLLAVHYAVLGTFDSDDSTDLSKTMAALDRRLKTAERWAQSLEKFGKFPRPKVPARSRDSQAA
jgi:AcrR family transcriptional regulator